MTEFPFKNFNPNGVLPFKQPSATHVSEPTALIETQVPPQHQENCLRAWSPADGRGFLFLLHKQSILIIVLESPANGSETENFYQEDMAAYANLVRELGIRNDDSAEQ